MTFSIKKRRLASKPIFGLCLLCLPFLVPRLALAADEAKKIVALVDYIGERL